MISFENTEIAFRSKSDADLRKAYLLFKTLGSNAMVKLGKISTTLAIKLHLPMQWAVKPTIYSHFVGGETLNECSKTVRLLEKYNVKAILDYSVEGDSANPNYAKVMAETIDSIKNAGSDPNIPFAVFKPSAFGNIDILEKISLGAKLTNTEEDEYKQFVERIDKLCLAAFNENTPLLIDAEDSYYQKALDEVIFDMMKKYNKQKAIVFNTLQMYRHDRLEFLKKAQEKANAENFIFGAKFVRGAYMEKERERAQKMGYPSPIQPDKISTDNDFNSALEFSIKNFDRISIFCGTHNEESCKYLAKLMADNNIYKNNNNIWFAQLYGMSDHISFNLAAAGYNVAKYVPYGPVRDVIPYLIRRAEENTSVAGQTGRELRLLTSEINRRKNK